MKNYIPLLITLVAFLFPPLEVGAAQDRLDRLKGIYGTEVEKLRTAHEAKLSTYRKEYGESLKMMKK